MQSITHLLLLFCLLFAGQILLAQTNEIAKDKAPILIAPTPKSVTDLKNKAVENQNETTAEMDSISYPTGLVFEDEVYEKSPRQALFEGSKYDEIPFKVDLSPYCPPVGDQGDIESCVGWAVGYNAMTMMRAIENGWTDKDTIKANAHSAMFIFNQIKERDCGAGSKISKAIDLIMENGDCLAKDFDQDITDCSREPGEELMDEAKQYSIEDFMTLFEIKADPKVKIYKVKQTLANQTPVVVGMSLKKNFYQLKKGAKFWWPDKGNKTPVGGHAMVVVGYNEAKKSFRLVNSWGTDWADGGFVDIKYADFGKYCKYAYQLVLSKPVEIAPTELSGSFQFQYIKGFDKKEDPIFEIASPELTEVATDTSASASTNALYTLTQKKWEVGQMFQMIAGNNIVNEQVYIFSLDANNEVNIHWPRQAALNEKFEGMNESAMLPVADADLVIPSKTAALSIGNAGADYLCALFASEKIEDFKLLTDSLQTMEGDFTTRLVNVLGEKLIPAKDINYYPKEIRFEAISKSGGTIVPLILKVEAKE